MAQYPKNQSTREGIITNMCLTFRHDFLAPTHEEFPGLGMTDEERKILWQQMAQIFDNDISPVMEFKKKDPS